MLKFSRAMRYEYIHINSKKSVLILLKKLSNTTKSTKLKVVSIYSLRIAKLLGLALSMQIYQFSL